MVDIFNNDIIHTGRKVGNINLEIIQYLMGICLVF